MSTFITLLKPREKKKYEKIQFQSSISVANQNPWTSILVLNLVFVDDFVVVVLSCNFAEKVFANYEKADCNLE